MRIMMVMMMMTTMNMARKRTRLFIDQLISQSLCSINQV